MLGTGDFILDERIDDRDAGGEISHGRLREFAGKLAIRPEELIELAEAACGD